LRHDRENYLCETSAWLRVVGENNKVPPLSHQTEHEFGRFF
jgi:hypothetical protein